MAFISILLLDILALVIFINLGIGIVLGLTGIILKIKNHLDSKKGKDISRIRKIVTVIFCICGAISVIIILLFAAWYFARFAH